MVIRVDPERNELRALREAGTWRGKKVLEVGCGEGRLTLRLATLHPHRIHAIDPNADRIRAARKKLPLRFSGVIHYAVGSASALKHPAQAFDIVVFSWVLWWVAHAGMVHALHEAHRVLKPDGLLLDLRPGAVHRRVVISVNGQYRQLAIMQESLQDDDAANRAVSEVIQKGWYEPMSRTQIHCNRTMALKDFTGWLTDFPTDRDAMQERLIGTVEHAFEEARGKRKKIVVKGALVLRILKKIAS